MSPGCLADPPLMTLRRLAYLRIIVRVLTIIVYTAAVGWLGYCLYRPFSEEVRQPGYTGDDTGGLLIIGIILFWVLQYAMVKGLMAMNRAEERIISDFIHGKFPDTLYSPTSAFNGSYIAASRLFDASGIENIPIGFTTYGRVDFLLDDHTVTVVDIGVTSDTASTLMYRIPVINYFVTIFRTMIRPIFGARVDSSMHSFRGMFGYLRSPVRCDGAVILLPDHLEEKLGHMAVAAQAMTKRKGGSLVCLEDPEFENLFAVYADDEVEARKVLTPARMRLISSLRQEFGRDLLLSFVDDRMYYAACFPDGFLKPRAGIGKRGHNHLDGLYKELAFCRSLPDKLK